jgi:hypothetical protein
VWLADAAGIFDGAQASGGYDTPPLHSKADDLAVQLSYESTSDGTSIYPGGFALTVTLDTKGRLSADGSTALRETCLVGWYAAPPAPDRAELAGIVSQLRLCPDAPDARIAADCLAMLLLAFWACSASPRQIMAHEQRVLLREWRALLRARTHGRPSMGWMRGHAARNDWPYPAQAACDRAATRVHECLPPNEDWRREVPTDEALFVLWDWRADRPVLGG